MQPSFSNRKKLFKEIKMARSKLNPRITTNPNCKVCTSQHRGFVEDLLLQEVNVEKISQFLREEYSTLISAEEISDHGYMHFNSAEQKKIRVALKREKMRQTDEDFEVGIQKTINTVHVLNHLLEKSLDRYKYLIELEENNPEAVKERDLIAYLQQLRETTKAVHELNKDIRNEDYIPIRVFQEESAKLLQFVAETLNDLDRRIPGYSLRDEFLIAAKGNFPKLDLTPLPKENKQE